MPIYYSNNDFNCIKSLIKNDGYKKLYITGQVGVGKTTFSNKLCEELTNYKAINIDAERDKPINQKTYRNDVLKNIIEENTNNHYILECFDLFNEEYEFDKNNPNTLDVWREKADILILLNPKRPNLKNNIDYDLSPFYKQKFDNINGKVIYQNNETGTYVKLINEKAYDNKK